MYPRIKYLEDFIKFADYTGVRLGWGKEEILKCNDIDLLEFIYETLERSYWSIIKDVHRIKEGSVPPWITLMDIRSKPTLYPTITATLCITMEVVFYHIADLKRQKDAENKANQIYILIKLESLLNGISNSKSTS